MKVQCSRSSALTGMGSEGTVTGIQRLQPTAGLGPVISEVRR